VAFRTLAQRAVVDGSNGNLAIHGRSAVAIAYKYQDAQGAQVSLVGAQLAFEISGVQAIAGVQGPDSYTQLFALDQALVASLPLNTQMPFAVVDESTFGQPTVLWSGWLTVYGYQGAPP
jgi:hypothetical protein